MALAFNAPTALVYLMYSVLNYSKTLKSNFVAITNSASIKP